MDIKKLYSNILYYLTVPKCVCCREPLDIDDRALCKSCIKEYNNLKQTNCSRCLKILNSCTCVNKYLDTHLVHKLVKVFRYRHPSGPNDRIPANELIYNIKRAKRRDLLAFIVDELEMAIKNSGIKYERYIITNVPRKSSRVIKYGLDHSEEIAKRLSKRLGLEYVKLLKSTSKKPQKKTQGEERLKNAKFNYRSILPVIKGERVLLVDDIVTTGASMGAAAMMIRGLEAKEVVGVCLAIAFRDRHVPFAKTPKI